MTLRVLPSPVLPGTAYDTGYLIGAVIGALIVAAVIVYIVGFVRNDRGDRAASAYEFVRHYRTLWLGAVLYAVSFAGRLFLEI